MCRICNLTGSEFNDIFLLMHYVMKVSFASRTSLMIFKIKSEL